MTQKKEKKTKSTKPQHTFAERALLSEKAKKFDPTATKENCIEDLRSVQQAHPLKFITRTMYRHHGRYSDKTWSRHFGTFLEFRRGSLLERSRQQHKLERQIAKHASVDHLPEWYNKNIVEIEMLYPQAKAKRINTVVVVSDNHGKLQDPFVYRVFLWVLKNMQPDVVGFNGDQSEMLEFSRHTKDPRNVGICAELTYVRDHIFTPAREVCPNAEFLWLLGNHEWRVQNFLADRCPEMLEVLGDYHGWTWADFFGIRHLNINVKCKWNLKAFREGDVKREINNNYHVLWQTFAMKHIIDRRLSVSGVSGHTHTPTFHTGATLYRGERSPYNWTVLGCARRLNAVYTESEEQWSQGFGIFHVMPDTGIVVPENVIIQGDFAAVGGKYFYREDHER